jgi:hypothetical protein
MAGDSKSFLFPQKLLMSCRPLTLQQATQYIVHDEIQRDMHEVILIRCLNHSNNYGELTANKYGGDYPLVR